jgi:hypothetical protein
MKFAKNLTLMDRHKNTRGLSTLGCGQYYPRRYPLSNDKKSSCARLRHPNKIFNPLMTYLILRTSANLGVQEGGGRRRGVSYIMRISLKNILTTNKDCRSLSHTILDIQFLFRREQEEFRSRCEQRIFWGPGTAFQNSKNANIFFN